MNITSHAHLDATLSKFMSLPQN